MKARLGGKNYRLLGSTRGLCAGMLLSILALACPQIALAKESTAVLNVSTNQAQGTNETTMHRIVLGYEDVVVVVPPGEVIQFVRLDNPTQVIINFDGAITARSGGDGGAVGSATMLFLRQLNQPIEFPKGMFADAKQTTLSVVTNAGGKTNLYRFRLLLAGGVPPHSVIQLITSPAPAPAQLISVSQEYQQTVLGQLSRGLAHAEAKKLIDTNSPAYSQVKQTIALMQNGTPFAAATQQTNVPTPLIERLRGYGNQAPQ